VTRARGSLVASQQDMEKGRESVLNLDSEAASGVGHQFAPSLSRPLTLGTFAIQAKRVSSVLCTTVR
jgi:hypothetical protein